MTPTTDAPAKAARPKSWRTRLAHPTWSLAADKCPSCGFPEAEGGYCEECGWSAPLKRRTR